MKRKIKVLHLLWSGRAGGAERFAKDIVTYADKERFLHAVCFLSDEGWLGEEFRKQGAQVYSLGMKSGASLLKAARIFRLFGNFGPDIIQSHVRNYLANGFALLTPRTVKIYFEHGGDINSPKRGKAVQFYFFIGSYFDRVLANSLHSKDLLCRYTSTKNKKIEVLYLGIDPLLFNAEKAGIDAKRALGIPEANRVAGVVCRLVEPKGLDDFIETAAKIFEKATNWTFLVVGDGPLMEHLRLLAAGKKADIRFLGERQDVSKIMKAMDVYLMTSRWEAFGLSVLEALSSGVPVLGFKVGGVGEILERGGGGMLLEGRDTSKLASLAVEAVSDQTRYDSLSRDGVRNVRENFDIRRSIRELESIYEASVKK